MRAKQTFTLPFAKRCPLLPAAAEFHPSACNLFMYSSSKGTINLADMRDSALCDRSCKGEGCVSCFCLYL